MECFGEPTKKGYEAGWITTYLQWTVDIVDLEGRERRVGVLVELKEAGGEGMTVWDRASSWEWACLKVFSVDQDEGS